MLALVPILPFAVVRRVADRLERHYLLRGPFESGRGLGKPLVFHRLDGAIHGEPELVGQPRRFDLQSHTEVVEVLGGRRHLGGESFCPVFQVRPMVLDRLEVGGAQLSEPRGQALLSRVVATQVTRQLFRVARSRLGSIHQGAVLPVLEHLRQQPEQRSLERFDHGAGARRVFESEVVLQQPGDGRTRLVAILKGAPLHGVDRRVVVLRNPRLGIVKKRHACRQREGDFADVAHVQDRHARHPVIHRLGEFLLDQRGRNPLDPLVVAVGQMKVDPVVLVAP